MLSKGPSLAVPACFVSNTRVPIKNATTPCVYSGVHIHSRLWGVLCDMVDQI